MVNKLTVSDIKDITKDTFKNALPILEEQINEAIISAEKNNNTKIDTVTKQAILNVASTIYYSSTETTVSLIATLINEKLT